MTNNKFYSKRTEQFMKKKTIKHSVKNAAISAFWLMVPCALVGVVVLDWVGVFKIGSLL